MAEPLEDTLARAEQVRTELTQILDQLRGEREAVKSATAEAHDAIQGLRTAIREAKEEMRQSGKAEARKYLARQMRAAADILARD
jgi:vacuolar-type H+-ATPase subunit H